MIIFVTVTLQEQREQEELFISRNDLKANSTLDYLKSYLINIAKWESFCHYILLLDISRIVAFCNSFFREVSEEIAK